jgi:hypothetical protein
VNAPSLVTLILDGFFEESYMICLCTVVASFGRMIKLKSLRFANTTVPALEMFLSTLFYLIYLESLEIQTARLLEHEWPDFSLVKQNGSLTQFAWRNNNGDLFYPLVHKRIDVYLQRNGELPVLLSKLDRSRHGTKMPLVPRLMQAARHAPGTAPNAFLLALLAMPS